MKRQVFSAAFVLALFAFSPIAHATTYYWDTDGATPGFGPGGGTWAAPTPGPTVGWSTSATGAAAIGGITTGTDDLNFGTAGVTLPTSTISVSGTQTAKTITFGAASGTVSLSGGTIALSTGGGSGSIFANQNAIINSDISHTDATAANYMLSTAAAGKTLTFGGNINSTVAAKRIYVQGAGNVIFNGSIGSGFSHFATNSGASNITFAAPNSFTGVIEVQAAGTLNFSDVNQLGTGTGGNYVAVQGGSTLRYTGTGSQTAGGVGRDLYWNSGAATIDISSATGNLTFNSSAAGVRNQAFTKTGAGTFTLSPTATGGGDISGTINISGGAMALDTPAAIGGTWSNNISGAGRIIKSGVGAGKLTVSGTNSYTGTTTITGGTLQFAKQVSLYNNTLASWTASNLIVNSGATAAFNVGGAGEFTSSDIDTLKVLGSGSGGFMNGSNIGFDTTNAGGSNFTYSTAIADTNAGANSIGVVKLGTNSLTLGGATSNTYTGVTTVNDGTLVLSKSGGAIAIPGNVNFGNGSATINPTIRTTQPNQFAATSTITFLNSPGGYTRLDLLGNSQTLAGISDALGAGVIQDGGIGAGTANNATLTIDNSANFSYKGFVRDFDNVNSGGKLLLTKNGAGTQTLSGANITYTGATLVSNGTLRLEVTSAIASGYYASPTTVSNGATLELAGVANAEHANWTGSALTLNNGSTLNKTNTGYDTFNAGNVVINGTVALNITNSGSSNQLFIGGASTGLTGAGVINLTNTGTTTTGITFRSGVNATHFDGDMNVSGGVVNIGSGASLALDNTDLTLNAAILNLNGAFATTASPASVKSLAGNATGSVALGAQTLSVGTNNGTGASFAGAIGGTGALTKTGTGVQTLTGANGYTGATVVSGGTLQLSGATASLASTGLFGRTGGELKLTGTGGAALSNSAGFTGDSGAGILTLDTGVTETIDNVLTNANGASITVNVASGSTLTSRLFPGANATTGTITLVGSGAVSSNVNGGAIRIGHLGGSSGSLVLQSGVTLTTVAGISSGDSGNGTVGSLLDIQSGTINATSGSQIVEARTIRVNGSLTTSATGQIVIDGGGSFGNSSIAAGSTVTTGNLFLGAFSNVAVLDQNGGNVTTNRLVLDHNGGGSSATYNLKGGTLTINSSTAGQGIDERTGTSIFNFDGGTLRAGASNTNLIVIDTANVQSGGAFIDTNSFDITIAQALLAGAPSGGLTKNGGGTLTFGGANTNTYTGVTTVNGGILNLARTGGGNKSIAGDGVAGTDDLVISATGTVQLSANEQIANNARILVQGGSLTFNGSNITENIGSLTVTSGVFTTGPGTGNLLNGTGNTITWAGGTSTITNGNTVSDEHWVITGGTNTVNGGALGGILQVSTQAGSPTDMHFGGTASPTITLDSSGAVAGRILLRNDVFVDASLTSGTAQILSGGALANPGFVDLDGGTRTFDINDGLTNPDMLISARIQNGSLVKTGAGQLRLTGDSTYAGSTTVNNGTLELAAGALQNGSIAVNAGTFQQTGGTNNIAGTGGSGNLTIAPAATGYQLQGGTLDFGDYAAGGTAWTPADTSTITMATGSQFSFTGGILQDVSTITVTDGSAFTQSGGNFYIGQQGIGPAAQSTINGGFSLLAGIIHFDAFGKDLTPEQCCDGVASNNDQLTVTGNVLLDSVVSLDVQGPYIAQFGDAFTLFCADSITLGPNFGLDGGFFRVIPTGDPNNPFALQAIVPEPASVAIWTMIGLAGIAGMWGVRTRRKESRAK